MIYDLRTAVKWRVLQGACCAVSVVGVDHVNQSGFILHSYVYRVGDTAFTFPIRIRKIKILKAMLEKNPTHSPDSGHRGPISAAQFDKT